MRPLYRTADVEYTTEWCRFVNPDESVSGLVELLVPVGLVRALLPGQTAPLLDTALLSGYTLAIVMTTYRRRR
jgi:hypothetical protein